MKIVGYVLMAAGAGSIILGATYVAEYYKLGFMLGGLIVLGLGYLLSQRNSAPTEERPVTEEDLSRLSQKMDTVQRAFFDEVFQPSGNVGFYSGYLSIYMKSTGRFAAIKNSRIGTSLGGRHHADFQEGGLTYQEMVFVESILDQYIAAIPKV